MGGKAEDAKPHEPKTHVLDVPGAAVCDGPIEPDGVTATTDVRVTVPPPGAVLNDVCMLWLVLGVEDVVVCAVVEVVSDASDVGFSDVEEDSVGVDVIGGGVLVDVGGGGVVLGGEVEGGSVLDDVGPVEDLWMEICQ